VSEPSPQTTVRCACVAWTSARECLRIRCPALGPNGNLWPGLEDECACVCHDGDDDADEESR
jgi:hypothetical protein